MTFKDKLDSLKLRRRGSYGGPSKELGIIPSLAIRAIKLAKGEEIETNIGSSKSAKPKSEDKL